MEKLNPLILGQFEGGKVNPPPPKTIVSVEGPIMPQPVPTGPKFRPLFITT